MCQTHSRSAREGAGAGAWIALAQGAMRARCGCDARRRARVRCAPPRARAQLQWGPPASEGGNGSCNTTGCRLENPQRSGKYVAAPKIWGSEGVQR